MSESHREEIAKLEALYAGNPGGRVFVHLAEALRKAGEHARAESILAEGLARHADSASGYVVLGRVKADMGSVAEAEDAFSRVLELDGGNLVALRWLGDLAREAGRPEAALGHYRELLARSPSSADVEYLVREVEEELDRALPGVADAGGPGELEYAEQSTAGGGAQEEPAGDSAGPEASSADAEAGESPAPAEPEYGIIEPESLPGDLVALTGAPPPEPPATEDVTDAGTVLDDDVVELLESSAAPYELDEVDSHAAVDPTDAHLLSAAPIIEGSPVPELAEPGAEFDDATTAGAGERLEATEDATEPLVAPEPLDLSELTDVSVGPEEEGGEGSIDVSDVRRYDELQYEEEAPLDLSAFSEVTPADEPAGIGESLAEPGDLDLEIGDLGIAAAGDEESSGAADTDEGAEPKGPPEWNAQRSWSEATEQPWSSEGEGEAWLDLGSEEAEAWRADEAGVEPWRDETASPPDDWTSSPDEEAERQPGWMSGIEPPEPEAWVRPSTAESQASDVSEPGEVLPAPDDLTEETADAAGPEGDHPAAESPADPAGAAPETAWAPPEPVQAAAASEVLEMAAPQPAEADSAPQPRLATETLAELYMAQGFPDRAAEVYRTLLAHRPDNEHLASRLRAAETAAAGQGGEDEAGDVWLRGVESAWTGGAGAATTHETPYAWTEPGEEARGGPPIGEYLRNLVAWRSDTTAPAGVADAEAAPAMGATAAEPESEGVLIDAEAATAPVEVESEAAPIEAEPDAATFESAPAAGLESPAAAVPPEAADNALDWTPAGEADWQPESQPAWPVSGDPESEGTAASEPYEEEMPADPWLAPEITGLSAFELESETEPAGAGTQGAAGSGNPVEDAFNEWFETPEPGRMASSAEPVPMGHDDGDAAGSEGPAVPASSLTVEDSEEDQDEDLEMFRSWLQSLKK